MPSFLKFYLDLEATGEIVAPQYTTIGSVTHISIISPIPIAELYDMKIVDSLGVEHPFLPTYPNSAEFDIETILEDFPLGTTTVHASILDVLGNRTALTPKSFEVLKTSLLFVQVSDSAEFEFALSDSLTYKIKLLDSEPFGISLSDKGEE